MKKFLSLLLALALTLGLTGVLAAQPVSLLVWVGDDADQPWVEGVIERFKAANPDTVFDIQVGIQSESTAGATVLTDVTAAADVFTFPDDQLNDLVNAGALQPVSENTDAIITANTEGSVAAAMIDGTLYAYPATADNGYFMFYNKSYFSEDDVKSFNRMLDVAAAAGKKVSMELSSGWYLYSFFAGAGLEMALTDDRVSNASNWNAADTEFTGVQVTEAILDIAKHPGFVNQGDAEFQTGVKDGSVIAGVNGVWNANVAQEAWGENYAAAPLPTFTVAGREVQMASFAGYKLVGVNAYSDEVGWAMKLAEFMTSEESQISRFEIRGQGPANLNAGGSESVQGAPAIAALAAQSAYATTQRVGGNYWAPAATFGAILAAGNPDNTDLQTL
ncbi:MAG TPA: extracellular solute-binding protein, partial [Candidatus Limnocylindria bacterium]|nr:extracellular solute-binding protein [Candidatus Limnocylindria bacterium]